MLTRSIMLLMTLVLVSSEFVGSFPENLIIVLERKLVLFARQDRRVKPRMFICMYVAGDGVGADEKVVLDLDYKS